MSNSKTFKQKPKKSVFSQTNNGCKEIHLKLQFIIFNFMKLVVTKTYDSSLQLYII